MDVILYQAGKQQLLRRREDLHAAHRLEGLPHLQARNTTLQSHRRPAANSDLKSPGSSLHDAYVASSHATWIGQCTHFVDDCLSNAAIIAKRLLVLAIVSIYYVSSILHNTVVLCILLERRRCTAGGASKNIIPDEL